MKFDIHMSADLDHANPIEKTDMYSATVLTIRSTDVESSEYDNTDDAEENHFDLTDFVKITEDGVIHSKIWTIWNYNSQMSSRNSVSFESNNINDEMMNISYITGLNVKDIRNIFRALKKMRDEFKFNYTIPDTDYKQN